MSHHLAQVNIARIIAPLDSAQMAAFVNNLAEINALAEQAPGFVWRLQTAAGDATAIQVYDDARIIINLSVWESLAALHRYTYHSTHADFFRRRREWFEKLETPALALWWQPIGQLPTPREAQARLAYLQAHGVTPHAFTFKQAFTIAQMQAYPAL
ncbi:MAG: DUF3291 domain-containing protein [Chloroflexi bacterium]|nr:DUF3291 domain-containing protein [Chloroflexota bacterium]